jgi:hypothetical protein
VFVDFHFIFPEYNKIPNAIYQPDEASNQSVFFNVCDASFFRFAKWKDTPSQRSCFYHCLRGDCLVLAFMGIFHKETGGGRSENPLRGVMIRM